MRNLVLTIVTLLLCLPPAVAQTDRATITGTVTDTQGASVRGARVTAKANATGLTYAVVTNSSGVYVISSLPVGAYTETITDSGFQPVQFQQFSVQVGETRQLDA